jgi:alpha-glucoside transport system permease protein
MNVAATPTTSTPPAVMVSGMSARAGRVRRRLTSRSATVFALLIAVLWTTPTFGLLISSFRPERQIKTTGWWMFFGDPQVTLDNYREVLLEGSNPLSGYFLNSFVITVPSVLFSVFLASLAAYALSWMEWRGRDLVFVGIFTLQIVPLQMALVPLLQIFVSWGLEDYQKYWTVWIAHTVFGLPLAIFLLHNFMSEVPRELVEAARMDGADHARIFRSIALPLVVPALASLAIFQFLWIWNDLLVSLIFAGGTAEVAPLTVRLAELAGTRGNEWQRLTSGAFVSMIVPLLVFLSLQRYFVRGLLAGGLKG